MIAGRYEVTGVLGEGGTGVVYDAIRREDGKPVALKVMHAELAGDEQVRGRFRREAAILERLSGPHICPILDHGEVPGDKTGRALVYLAIRTGMARVRFRIWRRDSVTARHSIASYRQ